MVLPLLNFLEERGLYEKSDLQRSRVETIMRTNMIDLALDIHKESKGSDVHQKELTKRREEVIVNMTRLNEEVKPILELVQDPARVEELRREKLFNQAYLQQQLSITPQHVQVLHRYAKFVYDCGDYGSASNLLVHFRMLTTNVDEAFTALWGKLASDILLAATAGRAQNWDEALETLLALKDAIEARLNTPAAMQLQQRAWLMHWALFLLGNHSSGRTVVADLMMQEKYMNAIQTTCPHLLRYLVVAVLTNPRRRSMVKELVRIVGLERITYSDPILRFLDDLYVHCNFENAQQRLRECAVVLDNDFFLSNSEEDFLSSARLYIFETYCRIHERIDLSSLAQKLNMEQIAAEKWIVKMVADAQLAAKIDSQSGHVILGAQPPDVYQQIIEKTKGLSFRSYVLAQNIEKRSAASAAASAASAGAVTLSAIHAASS